MEIFRSRDRDLRPALERCQIGGDMVDAVGLARLISDGRRGQTRS